MKQPETLEISTVSSCTNLCDYCPQETLAQAYGNGRSHAIIKMSFKTFKRIVKKLPHHTWIDFSAFTEPFLNPDCIDMILYANEKKHPLRVFTTLVGVRKGYIYKLSKIKFIRFSLHLPDDLGVMKVNIDNRYLEALDYLLSHHIATDAMCWGPMHSKLVPVVKKYNISIKIKQLTGKDLWTRANNVHNTQHVRLLKNSKKAGKLFCKPILQKNGGPVGRINHNVLLPDGRVVLCCNDYGLSHVLGNLLTDDYNSLFLSAEYQKVMNGLADESLSILCRWCEHAVTIN
jgi:hypothetical protein